jgi:L-ascorbate metabolism protein UlaG (beta-lactamase superfamily)
MEIEYKGANCITIKTKATTIAIDPKLSIVGLKDQIAKANVQIATQSRFGIEGGEALLLDGPGEYEVSGFSVKGIAAQVHSDTPDEGKRATMYRLDNGDIAIAVVGHVTAPLSEEQLEALGIVDIAVIPVGGSGYTLDAHMAVQVVRQLDPKLVIPTHYADESTKYEVEQMDLEPFTKELGVPVETMPKLKLKGALINETMSAVVLERVA